MSEREWYIQKIVELLGEVESGRLLRAVYAYLRNYLEAGESGGSK